MTGETFHHGLLNEVLYNRSYWDKSQIWIVSSRKHVIKQRLNLYIQMNSNWIFRTVAVPYPKVLCFERSLPYVAVEQNCRSVFTPPKESVKWTGASLQSCQAAINLLIKSALDNV